MCMFVAKDCFSILPNPVFQSFPFFCPTFPSLSSPLFQTFFSLSDNFLFFLVQPFLHPHVSNSLSFSCFSFSFLFQSLPKRKTFHFSPSQKFPVLENFFRMQRYKIITTSKQKTNFFFKKTQKKLFFLFPTPLIVL